MKETIDALAPWPMLQGLVIGLVIAGSAAWAIRRGLQDHSKNNTAEENLDAQRQQWAAYQQLRNIEQGVLKIVDSQTRMVDSVNRLVDVIWNRQQR